MFLLHGLNIVLNSCLQQIEKNKAPLALELLKQPSPQPTGINKAKHGAALYIRLGR